MYNLIHTTAERAPTTTLKHLIEEEGATILVRQNHTGKFEKLLKPGEKFRHVDKFLYILNSSGTREYASHRIAVMTNRLYRNGIRWANHLWFTMPGQTNPTKFKDYVVSRNPSKQWAS